MSEPRNTLKEVLAGVGLAAVSLSLAHGARVLWNSYKEKRNAKLEEYPTPNTRVCRVAVMLPCFCPFSPLPNHARVSLTPSAHCLRCCLHESQEFGGDAALHGEQGPTSGSAVGTIEG